MAVGTMIANQQGYETSWLQELGFGVMTGGAMEAVGLGTGKAYMHYPLTGGGWQNRSLQATKSGLGMMVGMQPTIENVYAPNQGSSLFGWRNVQNSMFSKAAAKDLSLAGGRMGPVRGPLPATMGQTFKASGLGGKASMVGFGGLMSAYAAFDVVSAGYRGYQQGGISGAAAGAGRAAAPWAAMEVGAMAARTVMSTSAWTSMTSAAGMIAPALIGVAAVDIAMKGGREYRRGSRNLELTTPIYDPYGTGATTRQRSIMAMNKSYINTRSALGNEAAILNSVRLG